MIGADMAGKTDLIGAFRAYAQKALGNDFNAEKAAIALNSWVKESGDALKERIERDTERAVKKLGLAKESDLRALREEISELRKSLGLKSKGAGKGGTSRASSASSKENKKSAKISSKKSSKKSASNLSKKRSDRTTSKTSKSSPSRGRRSAR